MEARACGVPTVVTAHEHPAGLVSPERAGLVVRPNDATALYEALQLLIDDPALRDRMGLSARRLSESLALDAAAFRGFDPADVPAPAEAGLRLAEAV